MTRNQSFVGAEQAAIVDFQCELQDFMDRNNISRIELSRRLGVQRQRVDYLFCDYAAPSLKSLARIAHALGADLEIRFGRKR